MAFVIGVRWNESWENLLFVDVQHTNPDFTGEHKLSCVHINSLSPEELTKNIGSYCTVCGRKIRIIKQDREITVKRAEKWVVSHDKDDITKLCIRNPFTLDEYRIVTNRNSSKKWLCFQRIEENRDWIVDVEKVQAFRSFISRIFKTEISVSVSYVV